MARLVAVRVLADKARYIENFSRFFRRSLKAEKRVELFDELFAASRHFDEGGNILHDMERVLP